MSSQTDSYITHSEKKKTEMASIERVWGKGNPDYDGTLSIVVIGASGNLAMLKVFLFTLCLLT